MENWPEQARIADVCWTFIPRKVYFLMGTRDWSPSKGLELWSSMIKTWTSNKSGMFWMERLASMVRFLHVFKYIDPIWIHIKGRTHISNVACYSRGISGISWNQRRDRSGNKSQSCRELPPSGGAESTKASPMKILVMKSYWIKIKPIILAAFWWTCKNTQVKLVYHPHQPPSGTLLAQSCAFYVDGGFGNRVFETRSNMKIGWSRDG